MATIDELVKQFQTDDALKKEISDVLADGKVSAQEFIAFCKKHSVEIDPTDLPKYREQAKQLGFKF